MSSANDPAVPARLKRTDRDYGTAEALYPGLTKREYFAAMAMRGLCSRNIPLRDIKDASVMIADSLFAKLERTK